MLLLTFVGGVGIVLSAMLPTDVAGYFAPTLAAIIIFMVFSIVLQRQIGQNIFGELGFLYVGLIVAYTIVPAFAFIVTGLKEDEPLAGLLPDPSELSTHLWRHVMFEGCVAGGYLLLRGHQVSPASLVAYAKERDDRTILFVAAMIVVCALSVILLSAPVESYYDHYVRYDHLPWLQRKFVSVCIRLSLGLYCVLLVFLFRNYQKFKLLIPLVVVAICAHEMVFSFGARIQALIIILQAVCLYHYTVKNISLRWGLIGCLGIAVLFSAVEFIRVLKFDFGLARSALAEEGLRPALEFGSVFFSSFHLYAERAAGVLPAREWPMFFHDFISLFTFGDFTRWNPMNWFAMNYYPQSEVPPFTLGPIADSAIWGGEADLLLRGVINGLFFACIMRWFLRYADKWWGLTIYVYCYASCILTLKYSVFFLLNPIVKNLVPTLLLVETVRVLRVKRLLFGPREVA